MGKRQIVPSLAIWYRLLDFELIVLIKDTIQEHRGQTALVFLLGPFCFDLNLTVALYIGRLLEHSLHLAHREV